MEVSSGLTESEEVTIKKVICLLHADYICNSYNAGARDVYGIYCTHEARELNAIYAIQAPLCIDIFQLDFGRDLNLYICHYSMIFLGGAGSFPLTR